MQGIHTSKQKCLQFQGNFTNKYILTYMPCEIVSYTRMCHLHYVHSLIMEGLYEANKKVSYEPLCRDQSTTECLNTIPTLQSHTENHAANLGLPRSKASHYLTTLLESTVHLLKKPYLVSKLQICYCLI